MANSEIDSLSLDIRITGLNKEDVTNIDKLSRAVARLTKSLKEADFSKLSEIKVPKGIKGIQFINQTIKGAGVPSSSSSALTQLQTQVDEFSDTLTDNATDIEESSLIIQKAQAQMSKSSIAYVKEYKNATNSIKGKGKEQTELEKQIKRMQKILKRFKTIAFIKAIRAILNAIVKAVKTGVSNLALFDKSFNEIMSNMKTSVTNITNSLALILRPFIEILQPFIQSASQTIVQIANGVSRLQASIKGLSTYTKISAKYMDDFSKSSQKASLFTFDTFNTLDLQDSSGMFETANVEEQEESNDELQKSANFLKSIQKLLSNVLEAVKIIGREVLTLLEYLMPTITEIFNLINNILEPILPFVKNLLTALNPIVNVVLNGLLAPLLKILNTILQPIFDLIGALLPIVTEIVNIIVDVLSPILNTFEPILTAVNDVLSPIMNGVSFIFTTSGSMISAVMNFIKTGLEPVKVWLDVIFGVITDIFTIIQDIFNMDYDKIGKDFLNMGKRLGLGLLKLLASIVDSTVNMFVDAINLIFVPLNKLSEWFNWGWELGIPHLNLAGMVPSFANGGIVGELWQMNEYGNPEMLYNANNSGNTSVINQAQLSLAFEQAIYNTGLLDAIAKAGIIQLDGKAIAQSSTFKSELNRTNPSLNLR